MVTKIIRALKKVEADSLVGVDQMGEQEFTFAFDLNASYCTNAGGPTTVAGHHRLRDAAEADDYVQKYIERYTTAPPPLNMNWDEISGMIGTLGNPTADFLQFILQNNTLSCHAGAGSAPPSFLDFSSCNLWGIYMTEHGGAGNPVFSFFMGYDYIKTHEDTIVIQTGGGYYDFSNEHP